MLTQSQVLFESGHYVVCFLHQPNLITIQSKHKQRGISMPANEELFALFLSDVDDDNAKNYFAKSYLN